MSETPQKEKNLEPCDLCMDFFPPSKLKPSMYGNEGDVYCQTCRNHFKIEKQKP